jgi:hypothetical protein
MNSIAFSIPCLPMSSDPGYDPWVEQIHRFAILFPHLFADKDAQRILSDYKNPLFLETARKAKSECPLISGVWLDMEKDGTLHVHVSGLPYSMTHK